MNALSSKFAKILGPTTRCISSYGTPLFCEFGQEEDSELSRQRKPMEKCVNEVTLIGRVGRDPTMVTTATTSFARFIFATSYYKGKNYDERHTDWHEILVLKENFRDYVLNTISKGDRLFLRGKLSYSRSEEQTVKDQRAKIILQDIVILRKRNSTRGTTNKDDEV